MQNKPIEVGPSLVIPIIPPVILKPTANWFLFYPLL